MRFARIALGFGVLLWCCGLCLHGFGQTDDVLHEIANLRDPAQGIREAAARNLGQMGDRRAVPALIAALNDWDPQVRAFAVRALAELKDPRAIEPLIGIAGKNADSEAILALGEFKDPRAIATLIAVLNRSTQDDWMAAVDRPTPDKGTAAVALGRIGATAVPPLLAALKSAGPASRVGVLDAVGWIDNAKATDALISYMKDPDPHVRHAVVVGLVGYREAPRMHALAAPFGTSVWWMLTWQRESPVLRDSRVPGLLMAALHDSDRSVQSAAAEGLAYLKVRAAIEPLIGLLRMSVNEVGTKPGEMSRATLRKYVATDLGEIGDAKAVQALIAGLGDWSGDFREVTARSLGQIKDPQATQALVSLLNDKSNGVRRAAFEALAQIKDPRATEALIEAMRKESPARNLPGTWQGTIPLAAFMKNPMLQEAAPYALNQIGEPAVAPLIRAMKSTDPVFRRRILAALNGSKDASAVDAIMAALRDTDAGVRSTALTALAGTNDPRAAVPFMNAWKKADAATRSDAVYFLCRNDSAWTTGPMIEAMKEKDSGFAARCFEPKAQVKVSMEEAVIPLLTDADNYTREIAARTLLGLFDEESPDRKETRAETALQQSLKDRNMVVICAAASYYVGRGEAGSEDTLIDALNASGEYSLAQYFLVCGNGKLEDAGRAWLKAHHRDVDSHTFGPMWGQQRRKLAA